MNNPTPISGRDSLRARIEAAERRNATRSLADQAQAAAEKATDYARAHPLTVIGGALAVGLVIGLATRPGRKVAGRAVGAVGAAASGVADSAASGVKGLAARGGSRIATLLGEAAMAYAVKLLDEILADADAGQDKLAELGKKASGAADTVIEAGRKAAAKVKR
jgi:DUF883 C-terminal glycine zipper region